MNEAMGEDLGKLAHTGPLVDLHLARRAFALIYAEATI
jgi:hypothetical protein